MNRTVMILSRGVGELVYELFNKWAINILNLQTEWFNFGIINFRQIRQSFSKWGKNRSQYKSVFQLYLLTVVHMNYRAFNSIVQLHNVLLISWSTVFGYALADTVKTSLQKWLNNWLGQYYWMQNEIGFERTWPEEHVVPSAAGPSSMHHHPAFNALQPVT